VGDDDDLSKHVELIDDSSRPPPPATAAESDPPASLSAPHMHAPSPQPRNDSGTGGEAGCLGAFAVAAFGVYWGVRLLTGVDIAAWFAPARQFDDEESAEIDGLARDACRDALGPTIEELEGRIDDLEAERDELQMRVDELDDTVGDLEARRRW
jgi:hypothetical protein